MKRSIKNGWQVSRKLGAIQSDCCDSLGETASAFGANYQQLDVHMQSPLPVLIGSDAYFSAQGSPTRAMIMVNYTLSLFASPGGWENLIGHEFSHAYAHYYGSTSSGGLGNGGAADTEVTLRSIEESLSDVFAVILGKAKFSSAWNWIMNSPIGLIYTDISGSEKWSDYTHSTGSIADNSEIFSALFKNMQDAGSDPGTLLYLWKEMTQDLSNSDSNLSNGSQGTGSTNIYDFGRRFKIETDPLQISDKIRACSAWKKLGLYKNSYITSICEALTPIVSVPPTFLYCTADPDPASIWRITWNPNTLNNSYVNLYDAEYGNPNLLLAATVDHKASYSDWRVNGYTQQVPYGVWGQGCRWRLDSNSSECDSLTYFAALYDACGGGNL